MNGDVSFDSNNLQTYSPSTHVGIISNVIDHTDLPTKIAELYAIAGADRSAIMSTSYPSKTITLAGAIKGSTQDDLDSRIDTFKGYFRGTDKNLDIDYAGTTRRYIATVNTTSIKRMQQSLWAIFTIEFICTLPFGKETSSSSLFSSLNQTTASKNFTPTIGGTAPFQLGIITLTIDSLTGTADYISISNDLNNQQMLLFGLGLANGDVIVIDCDQRTVTVNGVVVDYQGTFLELAPGASSITIANAFTTCQIDYVGIYYKRYL